MARSPLARGIHRRGPGGETDRIELLEDLRRLSPRQRAVFVLRYFDDLAEADTAEALGISVGTVKSHVRDALVRLRNRQSSEERERLCGDTQGTDHGAYRDRSPWPPAVSRSTSPTCR